MELTLGPGVGHFCPFLGLGLPYTPRKTKKGTLFIPRLILGPVALNPKP